MPVMEGLVLLLLLFPELVYQNQLIACQLRLRALIVSLSSFTCLPPLFLLLFPDLLNIYADILVEVLEIIYVVLLENSLVLMGSPGFFVSCEGFARLYRLKGTSAQPQSKFALLDDRDGVLALLVLEKVASCGRHRLGLSDVVVQDHLTGRLVFAVYLVGDDLAHQAVVRELGISDKRHRRLSIWCHALPAQVDALLLLGLFRDVFLRSSLSFLQLLQVRKLLV